MSASTERKNRAAAREAGTDKKTLARQEAEKKAQKSRRRWTIGSILVAILLIVIILLNSGFLYKHTTAASVGERRYSPAELSYYYLNEYSSFMSSYGSYASLFGLDTTQGVSALAEQSCPMLEEGKTWRDYFLDSALKNLQQVSALRSYADANGIALDESELAGIDEAIASAAETAKSYGYNKVDNFFAAQFGTGVNARLVRSLMAESALASKALKQYSDSLSFDDAQLEEYYASLEGGSDLFDYAYYYAAAEKLPVEGGESAAEGAEAETAVTEQTMLEARMTAEAVEMAYQDGYDIDDPLERLNAAIEAESDTDSATERDGVAGSNLSDMGDWLRDSARKAGDLSVIEDSKGEGYYVTLFLSRNDNHYPTVSVRHILIKAVPGEDGTYSAEANMAALERINEIKAEYESGDKTEESFAALAEKYSEDTGSSADGGLYENIYQGQMVKEFNDFCFAGHKSGDIGVVYGESSNYAGYHLIYFVGEGELYSNVIARNALTNTAMSDFVAAQVEGREPVLRYWAKLVG